jgi:hypothetical protein
MCFKTRIFYKARHGGLCTVLALGRLSLRPTLATQWDLVPRRKNSVLYIERNYPG